MEELTKTLTRAELPAEETGAAGEAGSGGGGPGTGGGRGGLRGLQDVRGEWRGSVQAYGGGGGATSVDFDLRGQAWEWGDYGLDQVRAVRPKTLNSARRGRSGSGATTGWSRCVPRALNPKSCGAREAWEWGDYGLVQVRAAASYGLSKSLCPCILNPARGITLPALASPR